MSVWYNCGSRCDAVGKSGVAHYLEHMAYAIKGGAFNNFLEEIGAEKNAFTWLGCICFYEVVPKEHMEEVLKYESARMNSFDIDHAVFASEKKAILEERNTLYDTNPVTLSCEATYSNIFDRTSAGINVIGWKHEIESLQEQDLFDYHNKWFAPNNATLVLVGDVDYQQIKPMVEKYFGGLKEKTLPILKTNDNVQSKVVKTITSKSSEVGGFSTSYIYLVPFHAKDNFRKYLGLSLAFQALNQPEAIIRKTIESATDKRAEIGFFYSANSSHDIVTIWLNGNSKNDLDDAEKIWHILKQKLQSDSALTNDEINAVKRQKLLSMAHKYDDIMDLAECIGFSLMDGHSLDNIMAEDEIIQTMSQQECNEAIREVFCSEPIAISRLEQEDYDEE
jgi:zinc protease